MKNFVDQVVVISGASGGVGHALTVDLAARGASLCLVGRHLEKLRAIAGNVQADGQQILCYHADLTLKKSVDKLATDLKRDITHIDVLIHAVGAISLGRIEQAPVENLDWLYKTNVRAPYLLTQALLPLIRQRRGQIVFINSSVGLQSKAGAGGYAATKHALKALADSLREEVNDDGIRVLDVFLGRTATPMQAAIHTMEGRPYQPEMLIQPQTLASVIVHSLGLTRDAEITAIHIRPLVKSN